MFYKHKIILFSFTTIFTINRVTEILKLLNIDNPCKYIANTMVYIILLMEFEYIFNKK